MRAARLAALAVFVGAPTISSIVAQGIVAGKVQSSTGTGVAGVLIRLDGDSVGVTSSDGLFSIRVAHPGPHALLFTHARFSPVMRGVEYQIDVDTDTTATALTVGWPDLGPLVDQACSTSTSPRGVAILGTVEPPPRSESDTVEVVAGWDGNA